MMELEMMPVRGKRGRFKKSRAQTQSPWRDEPASQDGKPSRRPKGPVPPRALKGLKPLPIRFPSPCWVLSGGNDVRRCLAYAEPRIACIVGETELDALGLPPLYDAPGLSTAEDPDARFSQAMLDALVIEGCEERDDAWEDQGACLPEQPVNAILLPFSDPMDMDLPDALSWEWVERKCSDFMKVPRLALEPVPLWASASGVGRRVEMLPSYGLMAMALLLAKRLQQPIGADTFLVRYQTRRVRISFDGEWVRRHRKIAGR